MGWGVGVGWVGGERSGSECRACCAVHLLCHLQWSFLRVGFHQGGLSSAGLSPGCSFISWSFTRVFFHQLAFHRGVLLGGFL